MAISGTGLSFLGRGADDMRGAARSGDLLQFCAGMLNRIEFSRERGRCIPHSAQERKKERQICCSFAHVGTHSLGEAKRRGLKVNRRHAAAKKSGNFVAVLLT